MQWQNESGVGRQRLVVCFVFHSKGAPCSRTADEKAPRPRRLRGMIQARELRSVLLNDGITRRRRGDMPPACSAAAEDEKVHAFKSEPAALTPEKFSKTRGVKQPRAFERMSAPLN